MKDLIDTIIYDGIYYLLVVFGVAALVLLAFMTVHCGGEVVGEGTDADAESSRTSSMVEDSSTGTYCEIPYSGWSKPGACELGVPCTLVVNGMALDGECRP
jgi:hypothetical protein